MKIRNATGAAAVSLASLLFLGACGSDGENPPPPGSSTDDSSSTEGGADTDAAAVYSEMRSWDPCEVLGDTYSDLTETLRAFSIDEDYISSAPGGGTPPDHAMCSNLVEWSEETEDNPGLASGYLDISYVPKPNEEEASARFTELSDIARDLYGEGNYAEKEITGWDEGVLFLGNYGVGDAFKLYVRDGAYLIVITLETGSELVTGGPGNQADFTVDEARDYLLDVALPSIQSAVSERLEETGVSSSE
ncbi:hypothetical protein AB0B28_02185 [Glycomyces sp. NPDC046736]|uniref:hypothetical protein n=1 Tax=Glycomyces sp. NPDC046736 TaxID=3155615 RepID=UPI0033E93681